MIFKAKYAQQVFRVGDMRSVRHFAWMPKLIKDDYVWFETYESLMYYAKIQYPIIGTEKSIDVYEWVHIADKIISPKITIEQ